MRQILVNDLNGKVFLIESTDTGELTGDMAFKIIYKCSYIVTNGQVTLILIEMIKFLLTAFIHHQDKYFIIETLDNGKHYYRFTNRVNFAMSLVPLDNNDENEKYLLTIMPVALDEDNIS